MTSYSDHPEASRELEIIFWERVLGKDGEHYNLVNHEPLIIFYLGIPKEGWREKDVSLSHIRVFGCINYTGMNLRDRSKYEPKLRKCFFIGYKTGEFNYMCYNHEG